MTKPEKSEKSEAQTKLDAIEALIEAYEQDVELRPAQVVDQIARVVRS